MPNRPTAAQIAADRTGQNIGKTVTFPDYHGRERTGTLEDAKPLTGNLAVALQINGRVHAVFPNTTVEVHP